MRILKIIKKIMILGLPLAMTVAVGWYLQSDQDFFIIKDFQVDVEYESPQEALLTQLKPEFLHHLQGLKGQNIWTIGLGALRTEILRHPWVEGVELSRRFPDRIKTLIRLNPVIFLFVDKKNNIFPILKSGEKMKPVKATLAPLAPLLRNNNILQNEKELKKLLGLYLEIPGIGPLKAENIASVDMNASNGLTLHLIAEDAVVYLGEKDIQTKALQVLRVLDYLQNKNQEARVIDASFTKKVLVRPRKRS